jgi:alpha 1,3-glucosidase
MICLALILVALVAAVDRSKFRTCQDTGFCRRHRTSGPTDQFLVQSSTVQLSHNHFTAVVTSSHSHKSPLKLDISFLESGSARFRLTQEKARWQPTDLLQEATLAYSPLMAVSNDLLPGAWASRDPRSFSAFSSSVSAVDVVIVQYSPLRVEVFKNGVNTMILNDRNLMYYEQDQHGHSPPAIVNQSSPSTAAIDRHKGKEVIDYGEDGLAIYADGTREEKAADSLIAEGEEEAQAAAVTHGESFGGHSDTMPHGPRSVGFDISFPLAEEVYGLPEHTTPLSLPTTIASSSSSSSSVRPAPRYKEPYRLYTLDVFEYELDETMALYGGVPVLFAHPKATATGQKTAGHLLPTVGVFSFNPSETFIDISDAGSSDSSFYKQAHWISESGEIDLFLLLGSAGDTSKGGKETLTQFTSIIGTQQLPPVFALGYHQCRWNYRDEKDVASVLKAFEDANYPFDVLWLDIEHTKGKRYFTWDEQLFPHPIDMQRNLSSVGRKMVTIVDPHIKRDDSYPIHKEATSQSYYIKQKDGSSDFDGWCWPGSSSYLDFTSSAVRAWWAQQFTLDHYHGSTRDLYTWNDMNEPSVFNGPEVSMPKDCLSLAGIEHREWHNLYGLYMQMATMMGQLAREEAFLKGQTGEAQRPFVLTRSFWAGSQRFGSLWTGDNKADWSHLKITAPMLLAIGSAGLGFAGADVGGFFGEPPGPDHGGELFLRWYQAGACQPFFRGHAHHDTQRREPYLFPEPYKSLIRQAALLRYTLLPVWYTAFATASESGLPPMRGMYLEYPSLPNVLSLEQQWMIGDSGLLAAPVVDANVKEITVTLPPVYDENCDKGEGEGEAGMLPWYELESLKAIKSSSAAASNYRYRVTVPVSLETIPLFLRPGSILPRKLRLRRSASLMINDPYTLVIAPGPCGKAEGSLYLDDEKTLAYEKRGHFAWRRFALLSDTKSNKMMTLTCSQLKSQLTVASRKQAIDSDPNWAREHVLNAVERVIIAGQDKAPIKVTVKTEEEGEEAAAAVRELVFFYDAAAKTVTVKKPDVKVAMDWTITFEY